MPQRLKLKSFNSLNLKTMNTQILPTEVNSIIEHTQARIDNWYSNAKEEYGVIGSAKVFYSEATNTFMIHGTENGKKTKFSLSCLDGVPRIDYVFDVWTEGFEFIENDHPQPLEVGQTIQGENCRLIVTKVKKSTPMPTTPNTYAKYCPNVFVAKCEQKHEKGSVIEIETKYGKIHEVIVFNLVHEKNGFYYYSIVRADGYNVQERAKAKAERYVNWAASAEKKSTQYYEASQEGKDFLSLGEPIKVGHHSEKRHRALIDRNWERMGKSVEMSKVATLHEQKSAYWADKADTVNLSMPESLEYFEFKLEQAKAKHEGLKNGTIKRDHSFSLTYAKKEVNELEDKIKIAKRLWA